MFGNKEWKKAVEGRIQAFELQMADLKKGELELRSQNLRLNQILRNLGRKLVMRLPVSIESLDKGLNYDLIYADEIDLWKEATRGGLVLDIRANRDHSEFGISDSQHLPYDQLLMRIESLPRDRAILIACENGIKSVAAIELLSSKGFGFLYVLKGGMNQFREWNSSLSRAQDSSTSVEMSASN